MVRTTKIERSRFRPEKFVSGNIFFLAFFDAFLILITSKAKEVDNSILAREKKARRKFGPVK